MGCTVKWLTDLGEPPNMTDKRKMRFYSRLMKKVLQKVPGWQWWCAEQKHKHQKLIVSQMHYERRHENKHCLRNTLRQLVNGTGCSSFLAKSPSQACRSCLPSLELLVHICSYENNVIISSLLWLFPLSFCCCFFLFCFFFFLISLCKLGQVKN